MMTDYRSVSWYRISCKVFIVLVFLTILANFKYGIMDNGVKMLVKKTAFIEKPLAPPYRRHFATRNLDCNSFFDPRADVNSIHNSYGNARIQLKDTPDLQTDCMSIRSRGHYPAQPLSSEEAEYPLAYSRIVYRDYLYLETMFRQEYQPQNVFCYSVDAKAGPLFKERMRNLQRCFPDNVVIGKVEYDVSNQGYNLTTANLACVEELRHKKWEYVFLLQNFDVQLKTNLELVRILKTYHGANDVGNLIPRYEWLKWGMDWSFKALALFKNSTKNVQRDRWGHLEAVRISKSLSEVTLSRAACDYIMDQLNLKTYIQHLEKGKYAMDEFFIATLNSNENVGLPGGYWMRCLEDWRVEYFHPTRLSRWSFNKTDCLSQKYRHNICIFGVEDLRFVHLSEYFFANKLMADFDFGAVECLAEKLYNKTHFDPRHADNINYNVYQKLAHVRYNKLRNEGKLNQFTC